jgi:hypothetical protein
MYGVVWLFYLDNNKVLYFLFITFHTVMDSELGAERVKQSGYNFTRLSIVAACELFCTINKRQFMAN